MATTRKMKTKAATSVVQRQTAMGAVKSGMAERAEETRPKTLDELREQFGLGSRSAAGSAGSGGQMSLAQLRRAYGLDGGTSNTGGAAGERAGPYLPADRTYGGAGSGSVAANPYSGYYGRSVSELEEEIKRLTAEGAGTRALDWGTDQEEIASRAAALAQERDNAALRYRDSLYSGTYSQAQQEELYRALTAAESAYDAFIAAPSAETQTNQEAIDWLRQYIKSGNAGYDYGRANYGIDPETAKGYELLDWRDAAERSDEERTWADTAISRQATANGWDGAEEFESLAEAQRAYDSRDLTDEQQAAFDRAAQSYEEADRASDQDAAAKAWADIGDYAALMGISRDEANREIKAVLPYIREQALQGELAETRQWASEHPIAASVSRAILNPFGNMAANAATVRNALTGKSSTSDPAMWAYRGGEAISSQVSADIERGETRMALGLVPNKDRGTLLDFLNFDMSKANVGDTNVGSWLYNAINSTVDSAVNMVLSQGISSGFDPESGAGKLLSQTVSNLIMGSGAATESYISSKQQGMTDGEALTRSILAGTIEGYTEWVGGEAVWENIVGDKTALRALLNSMLSEGTEEYMSNELNRMVQDAFFHEYGEDADRVTIVGNILGLMGQYEAAGYDSKEAFEAAMWAAAGEDLSSFLAGAFSGGASTLGGRYIHRSAQVRSAANALMEAGMDRREAYAAAEEWVQMMEAISGEALEGDAEDTEERANTVRPYESNEGAEETGERIATSPQAAPRNDGGTRERADGGIGPYAEERMATSPQAAPRNAGEAAERSAEQTESAEAWEQTIEAYIRRGTLGDYGEEALRENVSDALRGSMRASEYVRDMVNVYRAARDETMTERQKDDAVLEVYDRGLISAEAIDAMFAAGERDARAAAVANRQDLGYTESKKTTAEAGERANTVRPYESNESSYEGVVPYAETGERIATSPQAAPRNDGGTAEAGERANTVRPYESAYRSAEQEGLNNGEGERIRVRGGGQRYDGADSARSAEAVAGGPGAAETGRGAGRDGAVRERDAGNLQGPLLTLGERVSAEDLGISGGSRKKSVRVVTGGENADIRAAKRMAAESGLNAVFFAEGSLGIDGGSARGYIRGNDVFVRVDHEQFTATQLMGHEIGHLLLDEKRVSPEAIIERAARELGNQTLLDLVRCYAKTYESAGMTPSGAMLEMICDANGGMNIYAGGLESAEAAIEAFNAVAREVIAEQLEQPPSAEDGAAAPAEMRARESLERLRGDGGAYSQESATLEELRKMNRQQEKAITALQRQLRESRSQTQRWREESAPYPSMRASEAAAMAKQLAADYNSRFAEKSDADELARTLKAIADRMLRAGTVNDSTEYAVLKERALKAARLLVHNAEALNEKGGEGFYKSLTADLRGQKIYFPEHLRADVTDNWNGFRRGLMGRLTLTGSSIGATSIDTVYQELSESYGDTLFPEEITNPADQLLHIREVLDSYRPVYENPYNYDMASAVEYAAGEVMNRIAAWIGEAPGNGGLNDRTYRLLREQRAELEEQMARQRERADEAVRRARESRDRQVAALNEHYREQRAKRLEAQTDRNIRNRLLKVARRLSKLKTTKANRETIKALIGDLDLEARQLTGENRDALEHLAAWYYHELDANEDFIPDERTKKAINRLMQGHIDDMTLEEVKALTDALLNIENEIRTAKKLIDSEDARDIYAQGVEIIEDVKNSRGSKATGPQAAWDKLIVTETLSPEREARRITGYNDSDPLYRATKSLSKGARDAYDYEMRANQRFQKFMEDKKFIRTLSGKHAKTIQIQGIDPTAGAVTVEITKGMRMAIYLHGKNSESLRHIAGGGIKVPDMALYRKGSAEAWARGRRITLQPSQVHAIAAGMSLKEKAFADAAYDYFNGMSKDAINEVSEKLKGYSLAEVENYFPINTDQNFTKKDFEAIKFDGSIEGMGFLKERINSASPIMLEDMDTVLTRSIKQTAKYYGLAIPVRNFNKLWGVNKNSYDEKTGERNGKESSVQETMQQKWGDSATKYIEKMMGDLQSGRTKLSAWDKALAKARSNYAGSVLTFNLSVALKQAASYPTAGAVVSYRALTKALGYTLRGGKVDTDLIAKYTPLLWYRSLGYSTQELGDMAKRGIQLPKALNWIQMVDVATTRTLWKAAEYDVMKEAPALRYGTEEFYQRTAEVYNRIIEETQPNYTTMQRPQMLRSDSTLLQNLAMFKTQPFQNFNILYDAAGNAMAKARAAKVSDTAETRAALALARQDLSRAVTSQLLSAAVFAGMTAVWSLFRGRKDKYKDKDGEVTALSLAAGLGKDMIASGAGMLPFGSDVYELADSIISGSTYYGFDDVTSSAIDDLAKAMKKAETAVTDMIEAEGSGEPINWNDQRLKWDSILKAVSKVAGVPMENVENLFNAAVLQVSRRVAGEYLGTYSYLRLTTSATSSAGKGKYYDNLYAAYRNDPKAFRELYAMMIESGDFNEAAVKAAMENRMKATEGVSSVKDLSERFEAP